MSGAWCHEAFAKHHHLHFRRLADSEPTCAVARPCGACHQAAGPCERTLFVIDKHGIVAWSCCSPMAVNPGADGILAALEQLPY